VGAHGIGQGLDDTAILEASVAGPSFHWSLTGWTSACQASWWLLECSALARRGGTPILGDTRAAILTNWLRTFPSSVSQQAQIVLVAPLTGTDECVLERVRRWAEHTVVADLVQMQGPLDWLNEAALQEELIPRMVRWWRSRMIQLLETEGMPRGGADSPGPGAAGAGTVFSPGYAPSPTTRGRSSVVYPRWYDLAEGPGGGQRGPAPSCSRYWGSGLPWRACSFSCTGILLQSFSTCHDLHLVGLLPVFALFLVRLEPLVRVLAQLPLATAILVHVGGRWAPRVSSGIKSFGVAETRVP